jgi:hypothetical protein
MRKCVTVLALVLAGAGCTTVSFNPTKDTDASGAKKVAATTPRPPTVYPDQVNDDNAHAKALALGAEMDFDMQIDATHAPTAAAH